MLSEIVHRLRDARPPFVVLPLSKEEVEHLYVEDLIDDELLAELLLMLMDGRLNAWQRIRFAQIRTEILNLAGDSDDRERPRH